MTISSTARKVRFIGNGSATTFAFTFKVFAPSDLLVIRTNSAGVDTVLVLNTDFTAAINANQNSSPGGSITLNSALATGFTLTITTNIGNLQPTDLTNQGGFYPQVITDALDRAVVQIQQVSQDTANSIRFPLSDPTVSATLPTAASRAGHTIAFDDNGVPIVGPSVGDVGSITANLAAIVAVAGDLTNINTVSGDRTIIDTVAGSISSVRTTASNISSVLTNASNISAINTAASNITAIQNAPTQATNAANSASAAATSASAASTSASNAAGSATAASGSATTASTQASAASTSASNAASSASAASTSASAASTSATNAASSASAASTSATNAANSATAAAGSATNASNSYTSFDQRYLGAKSSNPTQNNQGGALAAGMIYFNTVATTMRVYNGSAWQDQAASPDTITERSFLATAGQTSYTFTGGYRVGLTYVWVNGSMLYSNEFTATDGTTITFGSALTLNDEVRILSFKAVGSIAVADVNGLQAALDAKTVAYPQNIQSGNYTLVLSDAGKHIYSANSGAQTITIPTNASVAFPIGALITIVNMGTTKIVLSMSGVSVIPNGSTSALATAMIVPGASVQLMKTGTNTWNATFGSITANQPIAQYLLVAGGGGGGGTEGGGGGAGGLLSGSQTLVAGSTYTFTVGAGGAGNLGTGSNGSDTTAFSLTAVGGGGGGHGQGGGATNGGSGGGAAGYNNTAAIGLGLAGQGRNGGNGNAGINFGGGGGGGAGGVGQAGGTNGSNYGGDGGVGLQSNITGTATYYAGGGGGGIYFSGFGGTGGLGGGANGGNTSNATPAPSGTANTGGGGGGGANVSGFQTGGTGGSGVVILSIPTAEYTGITTGSPTVTTSGSNTILKFTSSGTYTA